MKSEQMERPPAAVPQEAKQAGEARSRWEWAEPSVWTERMLTTLEHGVKGGKWFSLIDKVYSKDNLRASFRRVKANKGAPGVDWVTIEMFAARLEENLEHMHSSLREGTYRPQAIRRRWIEKFGSKELRPLGVPTVRDRVVEGALRNVLEPIFERDFAEHSYGFRPGRSCKDALRRVKQLLQVGYVYVVDADLKSYYDMIPHPRVMELVRTKVSDGRVLELLEVFLRQEIFEALKYWTPERGTPQGAVISPLLSNIYLDPLDHLLAGLGFEMVRYADDFIILCRDEESARRALDVVQKWVAATELELHPAKTRIVDARERGGFDFLGYHFERGYHWPSKKSLGKFKDKIRIKTRRTNGYSLDQIIRELNAILRGWFGYFKHSHISALIPLDQWIRMRLRSILRKRRGGRGRGCGSDHQRWPNAFFAKHGLFSLVAAQRAICQSF